MVGAKDQVEMGRRATRTVRRPRVLFSIAGLGPGGSEQQLVELLVRIHPSEVDATLVTVDPAIGSPRLRRLLDAGVRH
jgi:hypothetical protein